MNRSHKTGLRAGVWRSSSSAAGNRPARSLLKAFSPGSSSILRQQGQDAAPMTHVAGQLLRPTLPARRAPGNTAMIG